MNRDETQKVIKMDYFQMLQVIIATLNEIEVKGEDNLSRLLGCITTLKQMTQQPKDEDGEEVNG